jgi:hypothetical protein
MASRFDTGRKMWGGWESAHWTILELPRLRHLLVRCRRCRSITQTLDSWIVITFTVDFLAWTMTSSTTHFTRYIDMPQMLDALPLTEERMMLAREHPHIV